MKNAIINGDSLDILKKFPDDSFDSMITDPPAGIAFMNKKWDKDKGGREQWIAWLESIMTEAFRTLKPGAHILVWAIPRTSHWTATAIENADFEIRDVVTHIFGSGFPKSQNISKAIDKQQGAERTEVIGTRHRNVKPFDDKNGWNQNDTKGDHQYMAPASDDAKQWDGWGSALKPASEHWILARKPLSEKTIAANVLEHGTGGINIDVSRIKAGQNDGRFPANLILSHKPGCKQVGTKEGKGYTINRFTDGAKPFGDGAGHPYEVEDQGPETIAVWDCEDDCAVKQLDEQSIAGGMHSAGKKRKSGESKQSGEGGLLGVGNHEGNGVRFGDNGGASRFFYCAKASKKEKTLNKTIENKHPTVKSLKLMKYLINLITPPGGVVLDPFMGSGTTGQAALESNFGFVGVELEAHSFEISKKRCSSINNVIMAPQIELDPSEPV